MSTLAMDRLKEAREVELEKQQTKRQREQEDREGAVKLFQPIADAINELSAARVEIYDPTMVYSETSILRCVPADGYEYNIPFRSESCETMNFCFGATLQAGPASKHYLYSYVDTHGKRSTYTTYKNEEELLARVMQFIARAQIKAEQTEQERKRRGY